MSRSYALGEFLCPGCGGVASVIVQEQCPERQEPDGAALRWWQPWRAWISAELVCQGPGALADDDDSAAASAITALPPGTSLGDMFAAAVRAAAASGELGRQGDDPAWDHAGTTVDLIATRYEPIGLN